MNGWWLISAAALAPFLLAVARADDLEKEKAAKLEGTWTVVSQSEERTLPEKWKVQKIVIKGNRLTLTLKTNVDSVCEFTVDPTQDPKHLDLTLVEGQYKGRVLPGIYQLDGDELKYCNNAGTAGRERTVRPKEFKGDLDIIGTVVLALKREKP